MIFYEPNALSGACAMFDCSMCCMYIRRGFAGDVHDWGSEEILQRHEEARIQSSTETDTETQGEIYCKSITKHKVRYVTNP